MIGLDQPKQTHCIWGKVKSLFSQKAHGFMKESRKPGHILTSVRKEKRSLLMLGCHLL